MDTREDKVNSYKKRVSEWRNISISQLSFTNEILVGISIAFTAFIVSKFDKIVIHIDTKSRNFNWETLTITFALFLAFISLLFGISVILTRLYDFRISRQLAQTRKRYYEYHLKTLPDSDFEEFNFCHQFKAFIRIIRNKIYVLKKEELKDIKNETDIKKNFNDMRKLSKILGDTSWTWTKYQIILLLLSLLFFIWHFLLHTIDR